MAWYDFLVPNSWRRQRAAQDYYPPAPIRPITQPAERQPGPLQRAFTGLLRRADSIINAITGLGGEYDKGQAGRPDTSRMPLTWAELMALYRYNGYAQRYIDMVADDATRKGWKVVDSSQTADPMKDETIRLQVVERFRDALALARLGGGSVIFMVLDEEIPAELTNNPRILLTRPVDWSRVRRVLNLVVMDRTEAQPAEWEGDPKSPNFRGTRLWMLSPNAQGANDAMMGGQMVHHSRVLYFPGKKLPPTLRMNNGGFDDSVLEAAWDAIRDKTSIDQAAAHLAQELKINVLKIEGLVGLQASDQADLFEMRMQTLARSKALTGTALIGSGEEFQTVATPFTGFDQLNANAKEALSAATGISATRFYGEAPGGLNTDGESQETIWQTAISGVQEHRLLGPLVTLYRGVFLAKEGPFRGVEPKSWSVEFLPLDQPTAKEDGELEKLHAETDAIRIQSGVLPPEHVAKSRFSKQGYQREILPYDPEADMLLQTQESQRLLQAAQSETAEEVDPIEPGGEDAP